MRHACIDQAEALRHVDPQYMRRAYIASRGGTTMRRTIWRTVLGVVVALGLAAGGTIAWLQRSRPAFNTSGDGLALGGYDPVAYFPEGGGRPQRGDPRWTADHDGRRYRFAS